MLYYDKRVRYYLIHWKQRYSIEYYSGHFIVIVAVTVASMNSRSLLYPIPKPYTARLLRL